MSYEPRRVPETNVIVFVQSLLQSDGPIDDDGDLLGRAADERVHENATVLHDFIVSAEDAASKGRVDLK